MFLFRYSAHSGEIIEFKAEAIEPLRFADLEASQTQTYQMTIHAASITGLPDRSEPAGPGTVTMPITFGEPVSIFCLIEGGWLPLPFVDPPKFLADRNVVVALAQIRRKVSRADLNHTDWWFQFFRGRSLEINPALYAFEGNNRRAPPLNEFIHAFDEASSEVSMQLPGATLTKYGRQHYEAAYALIVEFADRHRRETEFLLNVAPQLSERAADSRVLNIESEILNRGHELNLKSSSFVVLAALACLYERTDGSGFLAARRIIKPTKTFSPADAHNALSDLRALEFFVGGLGLGREPFALCTRDRAIAAFWCGLQAYGQRWQDERLSFTVSLTAELFPRLDHVGREELAAKLIA